MITKVVYAILCHGVVYFPKHALNYRQAHAPDLKAHATTVCAHLVFLRPTCVLNCSRLISMSVCSQHTIHAHVYLGLSNCIITAWRMCNYTCSLATSFANNFIT